MKFCTKCGAKISDNDAKFCGNCGAKISNETFETETEQNTKTQSTNIQEIFEQAKATAKEKKVPQKNSTLEALVRAKQIKEAIEISKNQSPPEESTATNTNSQNTKNQNVWLCLGGMIIAIFFVMVLASSPIQNKSTSYVANVPAERETPKNTNSNTNSNSSSKSSKPKYNYTIKSNGVSYKGIHNGKFGVCLKNITLQKEIYCDFTASPRALGNFHIVEYLIGNEQNKPMMLSQVYLITDDGKKFSSDTNATAAFKTMQNFDTVYKINPQMAVKNYEVFDIPKNATVVKFSYEEFLEDAIEVPYTIVKE